MAPSFFRKKMSIPVNKRAKRRTSPFLCLFKQGKGLFSKTRNAKVPWGLKIARNIPIYFKPLQFSFYQVILLLKACPAELARAVEFLVIIFSPN